MPSVYTLDLGAAVADELADTGFSIVTGPVHVAFLLEDVLPRVERLLDSRVIHEKSPSGWVVIRMK